MELIRKKPFILLALGSITFLFNLYFYSSIYYKDDSFTLKEPSGTNRTRETNIFIYNRVPKCGSSTFVALFSKLSKMRNFENYESEIIEEPKEVSIAEQLSFTQKVRMISLQHADRPLSFSRHFWFVDFRKFGAERPIYFNLIRDPVDNFVSRFYFRRRRIKNPKLVLSPKRMNRSLESCVLENDIECAIKPGSVMESAVTYFCGCDPICRIVQNYQALQMAKYNLETQYSVVGVLEYLNETLQVMEAYVPRFFEDSFNIYWNQGKKDQLKNKNNHPETSEKIRAILSERLSHNYELYKFAQRKLLLQLAYVQPL